MMTYLSAKRTSRQHWVKRAVIFFIILLLSIFWNNVRNVLLKIYDPVFAKYEMITPTIDASFSGVLTYFKSKNGLSLYIQKLEKENEILKNEQVRMTLFLASTTSIIAKDKFITEAFPILSSFSSMYHTLRISKGFADGVENGMTAYGKGRVALGYIKEVSGHTALIELFSSPSYKVLGILSESGASVMLTGDGGGSYVIDVPRGVEVRMGEMILFGSDESLILGHVADIIFVKQDVSKRVYVRGAYNPSSLSTIYVEK